jgi:hypothetical protein
MGIRKPNASTGTVMILRELDGLEKDLHKARLKLTSEDRSGLVNLNRALKRIGRLKGKIFDSHQEPLQLKRILEAVVYIGLVARSIYSLFNCIQTQLKGYYEPGDYYKVVKDSWGLPPRNVSQPAWHIQGLSFAT